MNKELQVELIPEVKMHAIHGLDHVPTGKAHAMEWRVMVYKTYRDSGQVYFCPAPWRSTEQKPLCLDRFT